MVALDTGNVLLQQRAGDGELTGTWEFPGGHLDAGESPLEAALREFTEEVGAAVPTDARTVNSFDMAGWRCFVVEVPRQAEVVPGSLPQSGDVPAQIRWLAPRDALQLNLRPELVNAPWQLIGRLGKGTGLVTTVPGTLEDHVFGLLLRHYPPTDLQWVRECDWQEDHHVRLAQIDMAHRPGGRDMKRVESMTQAIEHGFEPPAIVLVKAGDEYKIADGYHRSDALKTAGIEYTAAYVGIPRSGGKHIGKWLTEMQYDASNKPSKK
jgi:8-oxo-dGTP diphosphatase